MNRTYAVAGVVALKAVTADAHTNMKPSGGSDVTE
jgi:hypothetical protein